MFSTLTQEVSCHLRQNGMQFLIQTSLSIVARFRSYIESTPFLLLARSPLERKIRSSNSSPHQTLTILKTNTQKAKNNATNLKAQ